MQPIHLELSGHGPELSGYQAVALNGAHATHRSPDFSDNCLEALANTYHLFHTLSTLRPEPPNLQTRNQHTQLEFYSLLDFKCPIVSDNYQKQ